MTTGQDTILGTDTGAAALLTKINDDMTELFLTRTEVTNARDGEATLLAQIDLLQASIAALLAGSGCPVSAADTTPGYLDGKLLGDSDILLTLGNPGGNETLTISLKSTGQLLTMTNNLTAAIALAERNIENVTFFHAMAF